MSHSPYLGEIILWPGNAIPSGWAICDGSLLLINDHPTLFNVIGTFYGGDGKTTFGLPDLRGRLPLHFDDPHPLGEVAGTETVSLHTLEIPSHAHSAAVLSTPGSSPAPAGLVPASDAAGNLHYAAGTDTSMDPATLATAGGGLAHNNMQPYLTMNFLISLSGIFPAP